MKNIEIWPEKNLTRGHQKNIFDDLADLETTDYNNDTIRCDLNDIATGSKNISEAQVAAKKIIKKYRNHAKKKAQKNQNQLADAETVDYNNDTNISDLNELQARK